MQQSSSSNKVTNHGKRTDSSAEVAEPHRRLEENSFPFIHTNVLKSEQKLQTFSFPLIAAINTQVLTPNALLSEQHARRTVTFDDDATVFQAIADRPTRISYSNFRISNPDFSVNDPAEEESTGSSYSSETDNHSSEISLPVPDLNTLVPEEEYIPGGFVKLDRELEDELLNDYVDDLDDQTARRNRRASSTRSSDHLLPVTRSPIELWQRLRILIAVHLYKIQNKALNTNDETLPTSMETDRSPIKAIESVAGLSHLEKLFGQTENVDQRKMIFGLSIIRQLSLHSPSEQYKCVDYYDVGHGYIIICNVVNSDCLQTNDTDQTNEPPLDIIHDPSLIQASELLVYPIEKRSLNPLQSIRFAYPYQLHYMICIPIFRLILGFVNVKSQKSLMILIGDASRKGLLLSKQKISAHIYSFLYIHEASLLFLGIISRHDKSLLLLTASHLGCLGRILLYNTQPLQFTSPPLFISELAQLPFQSMEPIVHICPVISQRTIGILSHRYFVLFQYTPHENILMKFCNPSRHDFVRCHYNSKFDYIIFAFIDGSLFIYQLTSMRQVRRYHQHWKMITDLKTSQDQILLLSASTDCKINVWNLKTLQHLYRYSIDEEILQIDVIQENLYYYRTKKKLVLFKLNLHTLLFSIVKTPITSLKLITDMQRNSRLIAVCENDSSLIISPVSGACLTYAPNITQKTIKQVLHDISRSSIYSLQSSGELVLYRSQNNPCVAEYKIQADSKRSAITCMTLINPRRTHLSVIDTLQNSTEKSLEKQAIFFGHANGYISLFQGDSLTMKPHLAHQSSIVCLETSRASMEMSNVSFTNCEVLLSSSMDRLIHIWDLESNTTDEAIKLTHLVTIEQEKNISSESIKFLSMIDNFIVANYSDQKFLHLWQLLNISIRTNERDKWGIVEHPTKGSHHHGQIQDISATSTLKLFASSATDMCIKIWDNTNSLLRELILDQTLGAIEFLSHNAELIIAYQNNLHLISPENYLANYTKQHVKQQQTTTAEDHRLEVIQPLTIPYSLLPLFDYNIKTHHPKHRLQRFERQLAGRFAVIESDSSPSDDETSLTATPNHHLSIISDDPNWSGLAEDVKDILRMKKHQIHQQKQKELNSLS